MNRRLINCTVKFNYDCMIFFFLLKIGIVIEKRETITMKCAVWEVRVAVFENSPEAEEEAEAREEDEAEEILEVCKEIDEWHLFFKLYL